MQGVDRTIGGDRPPGGHDRLGEHEAAEHVLARDRQLRVACGEAIVSGVGQVEQTDEFGQLGVRGDANYRPEVVKGSSAISRALRMAVAT
ncbi:hypothetical protein GCM10007298_32600 [Williamsia phyllosphaerae]|uniref:Uncharacterized protein n=1 Tax=Williamsia phyllosphaerae TaxID=885042 RepID=A0ABQ1V1C5_9NOCA|nr:hypothetical protein GCM10007298_32600 [Williamsia phyllosphaerae]